MVCDAVFTIILIDNVILLHFILLYAVLCISAGSLYGYDGVNSQVDRDIIIVITHREYCKSGSSENMFVPICTDLWRRATHG